MGGYKLAGLHPAQQFIGIAAHIAGKNFIGYDFTFGINNKAAAFRHTVRLDVYPKISRQGMGGIGQHGVLDFADALGGIVPRFMNIVRVTGNRIDLTARSLERGVLVGQILQLGRANEGKIRGVEEKDAPLTKYILFCDGTECVVLLGLDRKI